MKLTIALVALACVPALALPPASFGFPQSQGDAQLSVQFQVNGSALSVEPGALFGIDGKSSFTICESQVAKLSQFRLEHLLLQ